MLYTGDHTFICPVAVAVAVTDMEAKIVLLGRCNTAKCRASSSVAISWSVTQTDLHSDSTLRMLSRSGPKSLVLPTLNVVPRQVERCFNHPRESYERQMRERFEAVQVPSHVEASWRQKSRLDLAGGLLEMDRVCGLLAHPFVLNLFAPSCFFLSSDP